jgi:hypothetical protein
MPVVTKGRTVTDFFLINGGGELVGKPAVGN